MMATEEITFGFMGGTMAGQNVTQCSACHALVLSGSVDGHRLWHHEVRDAMNKMEVFGGEAVRRADHDSDQHVDDGPGDGEQAPGDGTVQVPDSATAGGRDQGQQRQPRKTRGSVK